MIQHGKKLNIASNQCNVDTSDIEIRKLQIVDCYKMYLISGKHNFTVSRTENHGTRRQEFKYCYSSM